MSTREYLIKTLTVNSVKGYLKKFSCSPGVNPNMNFMFNEVEKGAIKTLGGTDADGDNLVQWGSISISNKDFKFTPEIVDELCSVSYYKLDIASSGCRGIRAEDVLKLVTDSKNPSAVLSLTCDSALKVVAKAILDKSFCDEKLGYIMAACNKKMYGSFAPTAINVSLNLSDLGLDLNGKLDTADLIRRVSELKSLSTADTSVLYNLTLNVLDQKLIDYVNLPEVTDFMLMAMFIEILYMNVLKEMLLAEPSRRRCLPDFSEYFINDLLALFKNTSAEVIADGLSVVMLKIAHKSSAVDPVSSIKLSINTQSTANRIILRDQIAMRAIIAGFPSISYNDCLDVAKKMCKERSDKALKVLERLRSNFPCGNLLKLKMSNTEFFFKLSNRVGESIRVDKEGSKTSVGRLKTVDSYAFSVFETVMSRLRDNTSKEAYLLQIEATVRNNEILHLGSAKEVAETCGMADVVEAGTGASQIWRNVRTFPIEESLKDPNVKTPAAFSFSELLSEISKLSTSGTPWFKLPRKLRLINVDTAGISKQKENMKAFIADSMLGFNWLNFSCEDGPKISDLYYYNLLKGSRLRDYMSYLRDAGARNGESTYPSIPTISLYLTDDMKVEYEDFEPIFEVLDHVSELVNFINTPDASLVGKYSKLIPNMLGRSNNIASLWFPDLELIKLYVTSLYDKTYNHTLMPDSTLSNKTLLPRVIDSIISYYVQRLANFSMCIRIPTTCKISNRLMAELKKRYELSKIEGHDHGSPLTARQRVKHMFQYNIYSDDRDPQVLFNDYIDYSDKLGYLNCQVMAGYDINGNIVTKNFEYCEKFQSIDEKSKASSNELYGICRKLRNGEALTEEENSVLKDKSGVSIPSFCDQHYTEVERGSKHIVVNILGKPAGYNADNLTEERKEFIERISTSSVKPLT
jgi:small nuclear ribonucleoprotein (snRNP)-like protein